jgi:GR25 family glycosyltransferase involved in LPS biosynthesis
VAKYNPCNWIHYGIYTQLTPGQKSKNSANIMADGLILSISKGTISLANVGSGTNNYTTLWRTHQVYTHLAANLSLKNLYRFILQREPDNTGIVAYNNKSFDEVKNILLDSKEHHSIDQTTSIEHKPVLPYTVIKVNNRANNNLSNTKNIFSNLKHIDLSFFDASQQDVTNFYDKRSININWNYDRFDRSALLGEYGIAASQILVCEYIVEHNIKEMIVFEDDAVIDQTFLNKFYACYNSLPTEWDYLADSSEFPHHTQFERVTNNILIDSKIICKADLLNAHLGFMLYSNRGARKLLNAIKFYGFTSPIDTFIYDLTKSSYLNGYCTFFQNKLLVAKDLYGTLIDTNNICVNVNTAVH